jgi:hypothetical protein
MNGRALLPMALLLVLGSTAVPASGQKPGPLPTFHTRLSPVPIDLALAATIAGSGSVTATLEGRTLAIAGTFTGLKTPATVARLHRSPNRGIRGAPIADLTATAATAGEITGRVELAGAQVEDLEKGRLYVQLHSEKAPEGNLWGWLLSKPPAH